LDFLATILQPISTFVQFLILFLPPLNNGICEIKSRIAKAKAAFNKKRALFTSKMDLELRKKLVKCYIWSRALYGAETWTIQAVDQKHLGSFEMWYWRRMISWTDHVRNEEVLIISTKVRQTQLQYYIKYSMGGGYMFRLLRGHLQAIR
jgi:hypothetical protein